MDNYSEQQQAFRSADFLALNPVFTMEEFARYLGRPQRTAQYRVRYHLVEKRLKRLTNGVYATVPIGADPDAFEPDAYLAANAMRRDAVFAYHSALDLQGQGHSVWWTCAVCTARPRPPVSLGRTTIRFLAHPPAVRRRLESRSYAGSLSQWAYEVQRGGRSLAVTNPERTLVDGFRELSLVGGLDELVASMNGFASLRVDVLKEVLHAYDSRRLWAAAGWFLQRRLKELFLNDSTLEEFTKHRPRSRVYLVPGQRGGVLARDWNLVVPEHLQSDGRDEDDGP